MRRRDQRLTAAKRTRERIVVTLLALSAVVSVGITFSILLVLGLESYGFFQEVPLWRFLTEKEWSPSFYDKRFGIIALASGTFLTSSIALIVALPISLLLAIYLSEYATPQMRNFLKPTIELLAGIPSVMYGYFALFTVTPLLQKFIPSLPAFNALSPGIVLGFMILPTITSLSDDVILSVPQRIRDASYALGATKLQTVFRAVLPAARSGIISACLLGLARAVGETMLVTIAAGQVPVFTLSPLSQVQTMSAYIAFVSLGDIPWGSLEYKASFAVGLSLFLSSLVFHLAGVILRERALRLLRGL
ncbi:MAG: phosphate ABC transporter permease subunit PstC [Armatimonadetes bacterium]|nr:phosphate ABC transporter permease subunit PstC [Armatimonadota bacterium]MDW8121227.1 phosphate ABC transporter permease subunit PstC [Armatimonadota bacterium]